MTTTTIPAAGAASAARPARRALQTRQRLLLLGAAAFALALLTLALAVNAYGTTYDLFRGIINVNSTTVDASEQALQDIAQASQAAADYAVLTSDTPLYEQAQTDIFRYFGLLRDEMFTLQGNLQSAEEHTAYTVAETFIYSRFWRHVSNLVAQRSNDAVARQEYLDADNHVRSWINPALQELETLNFEQMVAAGERAGGVILAQVVLVGIPGLALALLLTYLSHTIRQKVRRYLTPGIDAAAVLSWVVLLLVLLNLLNAPAQLHTMINDAYLNVSASSRVLVDANLANRAESSALLDSERADAWNTRFDDAVNLIELRLCGQADCTNTAFYSNGVNSTASSAARISAADSARIDGITPLLANVTDAKQASYLENARLAYLDFRSVNQQLRQLISGGQTEAAVTLNTSTDAGTSQEAFDRFVSAMNSVRSMNRAVFDEVGQAASSTLQTNRIVFGLIGYALIAGLVLLGVNHRYREL